MIFTHFIIKEASTLQFSLSLNGFKDAHFNLNQKLTTIIKIEKILSGIKIH
jgi:hypothetical protein